MPKMTDTQQVLASKSSLGGVLFNVRFMQSLKHALNVTGNHCEETEIATNEDFSVVGFQAPKNRAGDHA